MTGLTAGNTNVTVSYENKSVNVPVTVTFPVVESITVSLSEIDLPAGCDKQLTVVAYKSDGSVEDVTRFANYQVADTSVASVNNGLVTGLTAGSTTITVSYGGKTVSVPVTVTAPVVESITVSPTEITIPAGHSVQLTVTAHKSDGSTEDVTEKAEYQSGNTSVASVSSSGQVTGVSEGNTVVTVTHEGQSIEVPVTVNPPVVESLEVQPGPVVLEEGESRQLTVTAHYSDGSSEEVAGKASYQVDDASIIDVTDSGMVTGLSEGVANVAVTYGGRAAAVQVTVEAPAAVPVGVVIQPGLSIELTEGSTEQLEVYEEYSDGSRVRVTDIASFQSSDNSVATVTDQGTITGISEGSTTILVTYGGETYSVEATVKSLVVTQPERPESNNDNIPVAQPERSGESGDGDSGVPVTRPERSGGSDSDMVVTQPERLRDSSPGTVRSPERSGTGDLSVVPTTRPGEGDSELDQAERPEYENPIVNRKTR